MLSSGTLGGLRVAGAAALVAVSIGAALAIARLRAATSQRGRGSRIDKLGIFAIISSANLTFYGQWITTPAYNMYAFVLLEIGVIVLVLTVCEQIECREPRSLCWPIAGLGAAAALLATQRVPSLMAFSALVVIASPFLFQRQRHVIRSLIVGVLLAYALNLVLVGSPIDQLVRGRRGVKGSQLLRFYTNAQMFQFDFIRSTVVGWLVRSAVVAVVVSFLAWRLKRWPPVVHLGACLGMLISTWRLWIDGPPRGGTGLFPLAGWWFLRFALISLFWILLVWPPRNRRIVGGAVLCSVPLCLTVSSGNGLISQLCIGWGLFVLPIVLTASLAQSVTHDQSRREGNGSFGVAGVLASGPFAVMIIVSSIISWQMVDGATRNPYRTGDRLANLDAVAKIGSWGSIRTTPAVGAYLEQLADLVVQLPARNRDCLVDLSGGTPGSAVVLKAHPASVAWLIGGYPGSEHLAKYYLDNSACVRGDIVLIESPDGERRIDLGNYFAGRKRTEVARIQLNWLDNEVQVISLVGPEQPNRSTAVRSRTQLRS